MPSVFEASIGVEVGEGLAGDGAGARRDRVADRRVGRIPVVPVALHEELRPVIGAEIDAEAGDVFIALVLE